MNNDRGRIPARTRSTSIANFWRSDVHAEVDDEIIFHIEQRIKDLEARGMSSQPARDQAEREFGDRASIRNEMLTIDTHRERKNERREYFDDIRQDLNFSLRSLRRSPLFSAMAIACVALGVAVATTIFGAVNAILLRPVPFHNANELVSIYSQYKARNINGSNISWPDYVSWRDGTKSFTGMGIWTWTSMTFTGNDGEPERLEGADVSASVFSLLAVKPFLGRTFLTAEESAGNSRVIILSYDLWKRRYGGDSTIVNRDVTVDGKRYRVVGVMPAHFNFPERGLAWRPFTVNAAEEEHGNRGYAAALARLKPGVTLATASADLDHVSQTLAKDFPQDNRGWNAQMVDLRTDVSGEFRRPLTVFVFAVVFVLLIATANVANLMLARGASRQQETAVRMALGAGRARIVRAVLTESLVISAVGGAIGLLLANNGLQLLSRAFPDGTPYYFSLNVDYVVVLFAVALTTITALLFGLLPAVGATQFDLQTKLRDGTRSSGSRTRGRARRGLVIAEVALSAVLLIGALLLVRSNNALMATDFGFNKTNVLTAQFTLPQVRYPTFDSERDFDERLFEQLRVLPNVESAGDARGIPFSGWNVQAEMSVEGKPGRRAGDDLVVHYQSVSSDFFRALGTPLLRGRALLSTDRDTLQQVGVINETLAKLEFPGVDPIGRRMKFGSIDEKHPWITIVGVVKDIRQYRLPQRMGPALYLPQTMWPTRTVTLTIRTKNNDPLALVPALRRTLKGMDADIPLYRVQSLEQAVDRSLWRQQMQGKVLMVFALMSLLLAAVGLYGIIAWGVAQRTREVGIRIALGSTGRSAAALVVGDSLQLTLLGIIIGVGTALVLARFIASLLYEVSPFDVVAFLTVPIVLVTVAALASWLPARRAARIDPAIALRSE